MTDIRIEWDQITSKSLSSFMKSAYQSLTIPFTRIPENIFTTINKSNLVVNLKINSPSKKLDCQRFWYSPVIPTIGSSLHIRRSLKTSTLLRRWVNVGIEGINCVNAKNKKTQKLRPFQKKNHPFTKSTFYPCFYSIYQKISRIYQKIIAYFIFISSLKNSTYISCSLIVEQ